MKDYLPQAVDEEGQYQQAQSQTDDDDEEFNPAWWLLEGMSF